MIALAIDAGSLTIGAVSGALVAFVAMVVSLAPKHWDDHEEIKYLTEQLRIRTEERDHYKSLGVPSEWGTAPDEGVRVRKGTTIPDDAEPIEVDWLARPENLHFDDTLHGGG